MSGSLWLGLLPTLRIAGISPDLEPHFNLMIVVEIASISIAKLGSQICIVMLTAARSELVGRDVGGEGVGYYSTDGSCKCLSDPKLSEPYNHVSIFARVSSRMWSIFRSDTVGYLLRLRSYHSNNLWNRDDMHRRICTARSEWGIYLGLPSCPIRCERNQLTSGL